MPTAPRVRTTTPAPAPARPSSPAPRPARTPATTPARRPAGRPSVNLSTPASRPATTTAAPAEAAARVADGRAASDPRFKKALNKLNKNAATLKKHPPAAQKAAEAQAAAVPPPKEKLAGAQAQKVEEMQSAEVKKPESGGFLELLRTEIEKVLPKNLGETDSFMDEDEQRQLKGGVTGNIEEQKEASTADIKTTTQTPPDTNRIPGKEVKPLPPDALPPAVVEPVGARDAMPAPLPDDAVSLQKSKQDANRKFVENKITPTQLTKANDPRFSAVLKSKEAVEKHADSAPQKYRASEQKTLTQAAGRAVADERKNVAQMKDSHGKAGAGVKSRQQLAKEKDEARRKEVTDTIERLFNETKQAVEGKLASLEADVSAMFDRGIEAAMKNMKTYVDRRKDAWKGERYGGIGGGALWLKDKLFGLPDEVKVFYEEGRKLFTEELDALVVRIAALVETRLKEAKDEIGRGQKRIGEYVAGLPKDLQAVGKAAETEVSSRFDELRQSVEDKKNDLAQNLAQRYKEARDKADESLKQMQEQDKGLVTAFVEKLGEIVEILRNFKTRIMGMLKKAADTIDLIVADPIGFLKNLLEAVKKGLNQFVTNIWAHLREGFMGWLFGALASTGITLPKDFSLPSILQLALQVLGITAAKIRSRVVKIIGERNMMLLEKAWELVKALIDGGPAALWEKVREYLGNLKEMIIGAIEEWVVTSVIKSAVAKLVSMFNPVGAIVQAIIAIYNTVMFFIERINQILDFVEAIINSVHKIATGAIGDAANWIEQALARTIPLIISFLARLLGLGGITEKIKGFILRLQTRVEQAIDKVIEKIVGTVKALFAAGKLAVGKIVAWWKKRKDFVTEEGHQHTLFFKGEAAAARLMMASDAPKGVRDRIDERMAAKPKPAGTQAAKLKKAREKIVEIESLMRKQAAAQESETISGKLDVLLAELANELAGSGIDYAALPPSKVTYKMDSGRAGSVTADPLTRNPGNTTGSAPSADIPAWRIMEKIDWQVLNPKKPDVLGPKNWVKMHLLSHQYHGPGTGWNLVAARKTINSGWVLSEVETPLKEHLQDDKQFFFKASVKYNHTGEAKDFPSRVDFEWEEKGTGKKKVKGKKGDTLAPPSIGTAEISKADLNGSSRRELQIKGKLPQFFAGAIASERMQGSFKSIADFKKRMAAYFKKLEKATGRETDVSYYMSTLAGAIAFVVFNGNPINPEELR